MIFYLQYDDSVSPKEINGKKIKKTVKSSFSKLPEEFVKVEMMIEHFDLYSVEINATGGAETISCIIEDVNLNNAINKCIEGICRQFSCSV